MRLNLATTAFDHPFHFPLLLYIGQRLFTVKIRIALSISLVKGSLFVN